MTPMTPMTAKTAVTEGFLRAWTGAQTLAAAGGRWLRARGDEERGEGVISAAIAVMIMAFLGAAMWLAFKGIFDDASKATSQQVSEIGK
jgi:hypothetical protein